MVEIKTIENGSRALDQDQMACIFWHYFLTRDVARSQCSILDQTDMT